MKWGTKLDVAKKGCPIVFQGHPSNFKVTWLKNLPILTYIGRFRTVTPIWIHQWLWNDSQSLKQHRRCAILFFKVIRQFSMSCGTKIAKFGPNRAFLDCDSSLNIPMALKCCTKLNVVWSGALLFSMSSIKFQGHAGQKSPILTQIERFRTVTQVWLPRWIWNDTQSLT